MMRIEGQGRKAVMSADEFRARAKSLGLKLIELRSGGPDERTVWAWVFKTRERYVLKRQNARLSIAYYTQPEKPLKQIAAVTDFNAGTAFLFGAAMAEKLGKELDNAG